MAWTGNAEAKAVGNMVTVEITLLATLSPLTGGEGECLLLAPPLHFPRPPAGGEGQGEGGDFYRTVTVEPLEYALNSGA